MIHDEGTNNKLLILFVLDKLEMPISEELLLEICSIENIWIPYLYCKQIINELLESAMITKITANNSDSHLLSLTADGRTCLSYFYNDIPVSVCDDVTEFVKARRLAYRKKQEFQADYSRNADGSFTVNLKILEIAQPLLDVKFVVATRAIATGIYNSWNKKAPDVYRALYDILVEQE